MTLPFPVQWRERIKMFPRRLTHAIGRPDGIRSRRLTNTKKRPAPPLKGAIRALNYSDPQIPAETEYFRPPPGPFIARDDMLLALPRHHVFGSEELSAATEAISRICPKPYVALHPADALHYSVRETETIELSDSSTSYTFPVVIDLGLPKGTVAIPAGVPGARGMDLPRWFLVRKGGAGE